MKRTLTLGIILVVLLTCVGAVSANNLVTNGGFEDPNPISDPVFITINFAGVLPGWTVERTGVDQIRGYWTPAEGAQSLDLSSETPGAISQSITTQVGQKYDFSFAMAGNPVCGPKIKKLEVYWDNVPEALLTFDTTGFDQNNMGWVIKTLPGLTATQTSTVIRFEDESFVPGDDTRCGVALDDIVVESPVIPTPEFPTMALPAALIIGLIGAVFFIRNTREN